MWVNNFLEAWGSEESVPAPDFTILIYASKLQIRMGLSSSDQEGFVGEIWCFFSIATPLHFQSLTSMESTVSFALSIWLDSV